MSDPRDDQTWQRMERERRPKQELTRQIVVRVSDELYAALQRDADANGRTVAQTVRFKLGTLLLEEERKKAIAAEYRRWAEEDAKRTRRCDRRRQARAA